MIYFDNAATSWPKPPQVKEAMNQFMEEVGANPGRSGHFRSIEAARIVFETREALSVLFYVKDSSRIVFTLNATESINLALKGSLRPGDHVITSSMEHNSVMRPLRDLEKRPSRLILINSGVRLASEGSEVLGTLKALSEKGVEILSCGTCLDFYGLKEKLKVGMISNMYDIAQSLLEADRLIRP